QLALHGGGCTGRTCRLVGPHVLSPCAGSSGGTRRRERRDLLDGRGHRRVEPRDRYAGGVVLRQRGTGRPVRSRHLHLAGVLPTGGSHVDTCVVPPTAHG